jgi:hypothetical protein
MPLIMIKLIVAGSRTFADYSLYHFSLVVTDILNLNLARRERLRFVAVN